MRYGLLIGLFGLAAGLGLRAAEAQDIRGDRRLHEKLDDVELAGTWYYNDLEQALREAKRAGKPLFVVLRCPP